MSFSPYELPDTGQPALPTAVPMPSAVQTATATFANLSFYQPMPQPSPWSAVAPMPWTGEHGAMAPLASGVMQFNGQPLSGVAPCATADPPVRRPNPLHKRKANETVDFTSLQIAPPTPKRHITDDQMALHMNGMHISHEYRAHQPDNAPMIADTTLDAGKRPTDRGAAFRDHTVDLQRKLRNAQRIVICDELRHIQTETLLPESLLQRIERPCTALVLWQPPVTAALGLSAANSKEPCPTDMQDETDEPVGDGAISVCSMDLDG